MAEEEKNLNPEEEMKEAFEETEKTPEENVNEAEDFEETLEGTVEDPEPEDAKEGGKDEKLEALSDQYKRLMAEFDNYRKRTEKEKASQYDMGIMKAVEKILPVLDNIERGLQSVAEEERENAIYTGMDKIYKGMVSILEGMGVEAISAVGEVFDPNKHNAVLQVENDELTPGTIAQELQKGYTYKGTVLRYSMVSVVKE